MTTRRILAWADGHYKRTGRWPTKRSGTLDDAPELDWLSIDRFLEFGGLGLPGGSSLRLLLAHHRGFIRGRETRQLSIKLILVWADRHFQRTGDWPVKKNVPIEGIPGETWQRADSALRNGLRGLEGGSSLAQLLHKRRGKPIKSCGVPLTVEQILKWADRHYASTGRWPVTSSGAVEDAPGERWVNINSSLYIGGRGLPGGSSLADMLATHRGKRHNRRLPRLTYKKILAWADAHRRHTGDWPMRLSGDVIGTPGEKWCNIGTALLAGRRGLPGGTTLAKLLARYRGFVRGGGRKATRLSVKLILDWADRHFQRTGGWPSQWSTLVEGDPGETWKRVDAALRRGLRGLEGGSSLAQLLHKRRGKSLNSHAHPLTVGQILEWADRHRERTDNWPHRGSGIVHDAPNEKWSAINENLWQGRRGLPRGTSLAKLLFEQRGANTVRWGKPLTVNGILKWADAHRKRTGNWPRTTTGIVHDAPNEKWSVVNQNLRQGFRGLPGGISLAKLLFERRGANIVGWGKPLTANGILKWADAYRKRTGKWPTAQSGRIDDRTNESWLRIQVALVRGSRGLPGGSSLSKFLTQHRDKAAHSHGPKLSVRLILKWVDQHYASTGCWPATSSGAVEDALGEQWSNINAALRMGQRGLPGGSSLADMLATHRGKRHAGRLPRMTYKKILAWADAHRRHTGDWPKRQSGDVIGAPGEKWCNISTALLAGRRGLPGGMTLAKLLAKHRGKKPRGAPRGVAH